MNRPEVYSKSNRIQRQLAKDIIDEHIHLIKWRAHDRVLDIGCGSGEVTWDILLPQLPNTFSKLVGVDISEQMIQYNIQKYIHPKVSFAQMDIATEELSEELKNSFDHIFSFTALHWVQKQRVAMSNIYELLKPGGDVLLSFIHHFCMFDVFLEMAANPKWSTYKTDVRDKLTPYYRNKLVKQTVEDLLFQVGYDISVCDHRKSYHYFQNWTDLQNMVNAVNPFLERIPVDLREEYLADFFRVFEDLSGYEPKNGEIVKLPYEGIVIYATKPF